MRVRRGVFWLCVTLALGASGCTEEIADPLAKGTLAFEPDRPRLGSVRTVTPYAGADPHVLEAMAELTTGFDLHGKVIRRTCGPTGGVCHNSKEFPDLHTPANFLQAIGAPCNVQPGSWESIYDRCERPGDRLKLRDGPEREIAYLHYIPGKWPEGKFEADARTPGLHIHLDGPVGSEGEVWGRARFIRKFVSRANKVEPLPYFQYETRWRVLDGGTHLLGEVRDYQTERVQQLLTVGVMQGDANRNGIYGAREGDPVRMITPGHPEQSYLIARLRGQMEGERVPGSRMPLANQPLSIAEMLALFCFVEGLPEDPAEAQHTSLASPIDYASCSYSDDPESLNLLGSGVTWSQRIRHVLEANCGGCHSEPDPQAGLSLKDGDVYARLLGPSEQRPELNLIEPFDLRASYLWLKVTGDPEIVGSPMPLDPLLGVRRLTPAELSDLQAFIEAGAIENE